MNLDCISHHPKLQWYRHHQEDNGYDEDRCTRTHLFTPRGVVCHGHIHAQQEPQTAYFASNYPADVQRAIRIILSRAGIATISAHDTDWLDAPQANTESRTLQLINSCHRVIFALLPEPDARTAFTVGAISQSNAAVHQIDVALGAEMAAQYISETTLFPRTPEADQADAGSLLPPEYYGLAHVDHTLHVVGADVAGRTSLYAQLPAGDGQRELNALIVLKLIEHRKLRYHQDSPYERAIAEAIFAHSISRKCESRNVQDVHPRDADRCLASAQYRISESAKPDHSPHSRAYSLALSAFHDDPLDHTRDNRAIVVDGQSQDDVKSFEHEWDNSHNQPFARGALFHGDTAEVVTIDVYHNVVNTHSFHVSSIVHDPLSPRPFTAFSTMPDAQCYLLDDELTHRLPPDVPNINRITAQLETDIRDREITLSSNLAKTVFDHGIHLPSQPNIWALALANEAWHRSSK